MLTEEDKKFLENRRKIQKIAVPIVMFMIFMWVAVYIFVIFSYPDLVKINQNGQMPFKLLPVFFNLFMLVLLIMFVFMIIFLKIEKEYLSIIRKIEGESPLKGA
ncbi:hypothetical protein SAMN06265182_0033 [Persephonella hydrogeniphila]|uniref:Uncharacterized protein n=1 Tax=Persephonella hydrogeniphila TaxID=198703 RepID=A0A285MY75_9AQUI|nr:hypothetical protein [Persephonella hydrogeniphila]SNZ02159.1 hypothetical protein SAMN06265182_0033 [Persephonella hydrogeniphila]